VLTNLICPVAQVSLSSYIPTKLKLYDFRREYEVVANLKEGKAAMINIVKLKVPTKKKK
jgi:hypothetical protein